MAARQLFESALAPQRLIAQEWTGGPRLAKSAHESGYCDPLYYCSVIDRHFGSSQEGVLEYSASVRSPVIPPNEKDAGLLSARSNAITVRHP
jgi:hypothetical protein